MADGDCRAYLTTTGATSIYGAQLIRERPKPPLDFGNMDWHLPSRLARKGLAGHEGSLSSRRQSVSVRRSESARRAAQLLSSQVLKRNILPHNSGGAFAQINPLWVTDASSKLSA